jgi:N-acetylmuramate 1-kinase
MNPLPDPRAAAAHRWALAALRLPDARMTPASADASFRRYFRIHGDGRSWVLMDAPPEREDCRPFIHVTGLMQAAGVHVPQIHAQDLAQGFLLLSDLGRQTWLQALTPAQADEWFGQALETLLRWQLASRPGVLPAYDRALLERELALFPDWFVARHLQRSFSPAQQAAWSAVCEHLVTSALAQPQVFVHRDFMPRNLMVSEPNPGVLDYQDAVHGPISYDVISLFKDAFLSWPEDRVQGWLRDYAARARSAGLPVPETGEFLRAADWMGLQRHLKVLGIFARIRYRDGKPHYLDDAPRFIGYVRHTAACYPELAALTALFDELGLPE